MARRDTSCFLQPVLFSVLLFSLIVAAGCGSGSGTSTSTSSKTPSLASITVSPASMSLPVAATQQFAVTATSSDGSHADVTSSSTWSSSNPAVATVSASGLLTAVASGTATITATDGTANATSAVTVVKTLTSLALTPSTVSLAIAATQQFAVTATYSDGSHSDVTSSSTWSSSNPAVATVSATGLLTAVASGTATITATDGTANATSAVTVVKALTSLALTPSTVSLATAATQQFAVTATYSDGSHADVTSSSTWSSSNPAVATVSATGLLTAVASGTATITATDGTANATSTVTVAAPADPGVANVTTWHYDNNRSGLNPMETTLNTANVNSTTFGKLFSYLVDGYVYAQPLYASNLTIAGASHNVVFVATQNDSVYAFDADNYGNGSPLWQVSLLQTGEAPQSGSIKPYQGIVSTPVIDLSSKTIYLVSAQKNASGGFFRLHALDLLSGKEKLGGPVLISASVSGTSSTAVNGVITLPASCVQRAALLLTNNTLYIGFGSCFSGWLLAYDSQTLSQTAVFNSSPDIGGYGEYGGAGGIWMGGGGPATDGNGNIYVTTGNGPWNGTTSFGDSVLKFNEQLTLLDYFTPQDWAFLQCKDSDLSAGGLLLLPGTSYALAGGKLGKMFLVNTASLGGMQANDAGAVQTLWFEQGISSPYSLTCTDNNGNVLTDLVTGYQFYGTAAFFNNSIYLGAMPSTSANIGPVRQFTLSNGQLTVASTTPQSIAPDSYGTTPFISANGTSNGIVWVLDHGLPIQDPDGVTATSAVLRAYDATNLATELYDSTQNASDSAGLGIKFTSPIVANGKVFIGTGHDPLTTTNPQGELDVYGLK